MEQQSKTSYSKTPLQALSLPTPILGANTTKWKTANSSTLPKASLSEPLFNSTATGSYASTIIDRVSFNLRDFSVGIKVEKLAELSDSQIQDVRFWIGENGRANQTGLYVDGSMYQTLLFGVVFESFTSEPVYLFGIDIGDNCNPAPILKSGVSFLGNWTAKVHDSQGIWLSGGGTLFKQDINVPVGTNNQYGVNRAFRFAHLRFSLLNQTLLSTVASVTTRL